jgi:hypothetical protein
MAPLVTLGCAWISVALSVGLLSLSLGLRVRFDPQLLIVPVPGALLLGLATWGGLECQYRQDEPEPAAG